MTLNLRGRLAGAAEWVQRDPERAMKMAVLPPIIVITFAVAASHTLEVGGTRAEVTGWKAWSVAGTLEILAAYSFFRFVRAKGLRRVFPALVSAVCAFMILWINLASIDDYSWAAVSADPWPAVFALAPAATFLLAAALIEVDGWKTPQRRRTARGATNTGGSTRKDRERQPDAEKTTQGPASLTKVDEVTLQRARVAINALEERGEKITADSLRVEMGSRKETAIIAGEALGVIKRRRQKETA